MHLHTHPLSTNFKHQEDKSLQTDTSTTINQHIFYKLITVKFT